MKKIIIFTIFLSGVASPLSAMWRRAVLPRTLGSSIRQSTLASTLPTLLNDRVIKGAAITLQRDGVRFYGKATNNEHNASKKPSWLDASPVKARTNFFSDLKDSFFGTTPERELEKQREALRPLYNVADCQRAFTAHHIAEVINNIPVSLINHNHVNSLFHTYYYADAQERDAYSPLELIFKKGDFYLKSEEEEDSRNKREMIMYHVEKGDSKTYSVDQLLRTEKKIEQILTQENKVDICAEHYIHPNSFFERQAIHHDLVKKIIDRGALVTQETIKKLLFNEHQNDVGILRIGGIKALLEADEKAELLSGQESIEKVADFIQKKIVTVKKGAMLHRGSGSNNGDLHVIEVSTTENYDMIRLLHVFDEYFAKNQASSALWHEKKAQLKKQFAHVFAHFEENEKAGKPISSTTTHSRKSSVCWPYTKEEDDEAEQRARNSYRGYWR